MKILMLTAYDDGYANIGDLSVLNKIPYCRRRNYTFKCIRSGFDIKRPAAWSKIKFVSEELPRYHWLFWTDADSIIMNQNKGLEEFIDYKYNFIWTGQNSGEFFIRNCTWSFEFLKELYSNRQWKSYGPCLWDNDAFIDLSQDGRFAPQIKSLPHDATGFNSSVELYKQGHFMLHFAGRPDRLHMMEKYLSGV